MIARKPEGLTNRQKRPSFNKGLSYFYAQTTMKFHQNQIFFKYKIQRMNNSSSTILYLATYSKFFHRIYGRDFFFFGCFSKGLSTFLRHPHNAMPPIRQTSSLSTFPKHPHYVICILREYTQVKRLVGDLLSEQYISC